MVFIDWVDMFCNVVVLVEKNLVLFGVIGIEDKL